MTGKSAITRTAGGGARLALLMLLAIPGTVNADCLRRQFPVAIDIGHTLAHPGAISARGVPEFHFNQTLAQELRRSLTEAGFAASFLVNPDGRIGSLSARAAAAEARHARLFLAIHHDSVQAQYLSSWTVAGKPQSYSDRFRGYSLFVSAKNPAFEDSAALATRIGTELRARGLAPTLHHAEPIAGENRLLLDPERGVYRYDDLVVLKETTMPAVLLEAGVILHRDEETMLADPAYRQQIVAAVTTAIGGFCAADRASSRPDPKPAGNPTPARR